MLAVKPLIDMGTLWQVGGGLSVHAWNDYWIPGMPFQLKLLPQPSGCINTSVADFINPVTRQWNVNKVLQIPLSMVSQPDKQIWGPKKLGVYTVKFAHFKMLESIEFQLANTTPFYKKLWKIQLPPKVLFFMWQCLKDVVPTCELLHKFHFSSVDRICVLCNKKEESSLHLFRVCPLARVVWLSLNFHKKVESTCATSFSDWFTLMLKKLKDESLDDLIPHFGAALWYIWIVRNEMRFQGKQPNAFNLIYRFKKLVEDFGKVHDIVANKVNKIPIQVRWTSPIDGHFKINSDGSVKGVCAAGAGAIIRDQNGNFIIGAILPLITSNVLVSECYALKLGLLMADALNFRDLELEVDSMCVEKMVTATDKIIPWFIEPIVKNIRSLMAKYRKVTLKWKFRQGNRAADALAN